jgi:hypothetical protein
MQMVHSAMYYLITVCNIGNMNNKITDTDISILVHMDVGACITINVTFFIFSLFCFVGIFFLCKTYILRKKSQNKFR